MTFKAFFCFVVSAFFIVGVSAQTARISGAIKTTNNQPAEYASVRLKGTKIHSIANAKGEYSLAVATAGTYTLQVSYSGFAPKEQVVTVAENETLLVDIELKEYDNTLQSVEVTGRRQTSYKNDNSFSAAKVEMRIVDIPQSISSITKEFIQDRQALRLNDIVQNVAGINQFSNYDDISMRGFRNSGSNGRLINGLRTINQYITSPLLVNIERVEFIKGPASAVFSNTNPGGTINMITKKPLDEARQSIQFSTGSFGTIRTQGDFTGALDKEKTWLYRMNVGVEDAGTYRDNVYNKSVVVAPSISFLPREGTRFNADFVYTKYNTQFDAGRPIVDGATDVYALPMSLNAGQPTDFSNTQSMTLTLSFSQQLTKNLSFNVSYLKVKSTEDRNEHGVNDYVTPDSVQLYYYNAKTDQYGNNVTAYLNYKANTGAVSHNVLAGYDFINGGYIQYGRQATGVDDNVADFSLIRPNYTLRAVERYTFQPGNISNYGFDYNTQGIYIQDLIKYKRFQFLLSLRQEYYTYPKSKDLSVIGTLENKQQQNALLPKIGVTYGITDNINIYGTYTTGFEAQDSYTITQPGAGGPFDPLTSSLIEAGAKGEFFRKRLFGGLAIYQIIQNNVLVSATEPGQPNLLIQRGQERARGVELEAGGYITPNFSVQVSYAYNDAVITESSEGDPDKQVGLSKEGAPKNVSGSWLKYSLREGSLKGLGLGVGHSQVSSSQTYARDLVIPSYVIFNAALYYRVQRFQIGLNVNNLADKKYLVGGFRYSRTFPGAPRSFMVNVGYTF